MINNCGFLLPKAIPDCVSSRKIHDPEKQNRTIAFHVHIITDNHLIKSTLSQLLV